MTNTLRNTKYGNKIRECDRKYQKRKRANNPELKMKESKEYKKKYPERIKAVQKIKLLIKKGILSRLPCEKCGSKESIQGHHIDYSMPTVVMWLCPSHHKLIHQIINRDTVVSR